MIWDETRESAEQQFISNQKLARPKEWFVPFQTAGILSHSGEASIFSILQQTSDEIPYKFLRNNTSKDQLISSGIYDCAALSGEIPDFGILLIHAYGATALEKLYSEIAHHYEIKNPQVYYNPRYPMGILSYEDLFLTLFGAETLHVVRHLVSAQDTIKISLRSRITLPNLLR